MGQQDIGKLRQRADKGFSERDANRDLFYAIAEYFQPYQNTYQNRSRTLTRPVVQYDSSAQASLSGFQSTMTRNITPPDARFAILQAGPQVTDKKERNELNKLLDGVNDVIYSYLNASNFYTAIDDAYGELAKGTMALWCRETGDVNQPFKFISTPISDLGLDIGADGDIDFIARKHKLKLSDIEIAYPDAKLTDELKRKKSENPDSEIETLEVQYYDTTDLVWRYEIIHDKDRIYEKEYVERMCFTPRWRTVSGNALGIGVCMMALADVRTLNKAKELELQSAAFNIYGIFTISDDSVVNPNSLRLEPATFIPVDSNANDAPSIRALQAGGSYVASKDLTESLRNDIRATMLDNRLPDQQPQPATALEIAERINQYVADFGAVYARLRYELIIPLFRRLLHILYKGGHLAHLGVEEQLTIDELKIKVEIQSPIGRLQQQEEVQKLLEAFSMVANVSPEVAQIAFKLEELPQYLTEKLGSAPEMLADLTPEQIKKALEEQQLARLALESGIAQQAIKDEGGSGGA